MACAASRTRGRLRAPRTSDQAHRRCVFAKIAWAVHGCAGARLHLQNTRTLHASSSAAEVVRASACVVGRGGRVIMRLSRPLLCHAASRGGAGSARTMPSVDGFHSEDERRARVPRQVSVRLSWTPGCCRMMCAAAPQASVTTQKVDSQPVPAAKIVKTSRVAKKDASEGHRADAYRMHTGL